jgi:hypothetical protein
MAATIDDLREALEVAAWLAAEGYPAGVPFFLRLEAELAKAEVEQSAGARIARIAQSASWQRSPVRRRARGIKLAPPAGVPAGV